MHIALLGRACDHGIPRAEPSGGFGEAFVAAARQSPRVDQDLSSRAARI
jgi:hypothetical protein